LNKHDIKKTSGKYVIVKYVIVRQAQVCSGDAELGRNKRIEKRKIELW
jgi:hypothetical protein